MPLINLRLFYLFALGQVRFVEFNGQLFNKSDLTEGKKVKQVPVIRRKD